MIYRLVYYLILDRVDKLIPIAYSLVKEMGINVYKIYLFY